ncbi:TPA: hypothetical protein ACSCUU_001597 [Staphylococcus aureus]
MHLSSCNISGILFPFFWFLVQLHLRKNHFLVISKFRHN